MEKTYKWKVLPTSAKVPVNEGLMLTRCDDDDDHDNDDHIILKGKRQKQKKNTWARIEGYCTEERLITFTPVALCWIAALKWPSESIKLQN